MFFDEFLLLKNSSSKHDDNNVSNSIKVESILFKSLLKMLD